MIQHFRPFGPSPSGSSPLLSCLNWCFFSSSARYFSCWIHLRCLIFLGGEFNIKLCRCDGTVSGFLYSELGRSLIWEPSCFVIRSTVTTLNTTSIWLYGWGHMGLISFIHSMSSKNWMLYYEDNLLMTNLRRHNVPADGGSCPSSTLHRLLLLLCDV